MLRASVDPDEGRNSLQFEDNNVCFLIKYSPGYEKVFKEFLTNLKLHY